MFIKFTIIDLDLFIRFEGKHKAMKSYAKNINSRLNLPYSIAKKTQFNFAHRLLQGEGLDDRIHVPSYVTGHVENKVCGFCRSFFYVDQTLDSNCNVHS